MIPPFPMKWLIYNVITFHITANVTHPQAEAGNCEQSHDYLDDN